MPVTSYIYSHDLDFMLNTREVSRDKMSAIQDLLNHFNANDRVYIPGLSSEPRPFVEALIENGNELPDLNLFTTFIPGVNPLTLVNSDNKFSETSFFPRTVDENLAHRVQQIPGSHYNAYQHMREQMFDYVVAHVSPADDNGFCSYGTAAEFMPHVTSNSQAIIGIINQQMPAMSNSPSIHQSQFTHTLEVDWPLISYDPGAADPCSTKIAENIATLIESGSTLQIGLGKVPSQLYNELTSRRNLKVHSGMITDGFVQLHDAGSLDADFLHTSCSALGSASFYQSLARIPSTSITSVDVSHDPETLRQLPKLMAINSAVQVATDGAANLEKLGDRIISNVGGAADFAPAAHAAVNGKSIIALPATAAGGKVSRIVNSVSKISLEARIIDYVVTEFGIADLSGKSEQQRKEEMINIAAPEFQDSLR